MSLPLTPYSRWESGTNQNSVPANDNSLRDEIFNTEGIADNVTAQPGSPSDGDWYILAATHTGSQWATFAQDSIAIFYGGTWYEFVPTEGNLVTVAGAIVIFGGSSGWSDFSIPSSFTGGSLTSALNEAKGTNIASASTTNIAASTGNLVHVTGTTTITALGTVQAGTERVVVFDGILILTHNATSLILPTGANITTAAGDAAIFRSEGSGNWRCVAYQRASGASLAGSGVAWGAITGTLASQTDLQTALDAKGAAGVPQNSQSTAYTLVLADANKHILHPSADTTARTMTIPANSSVAFPVGTTITFVNQNAAGVMTIAITTDTMRLAGAGTTGSRTLAANGIATALKITSTEWIINGTGLT